MPSGLKTSLLEPVNLDAHLPARLLVLSTRIALHATRASAKPMGLSIREWRALQIIGFYGPATINEVAERIAMDFGGTSRAIAELETRGFLTRTSDTKDRRRSRVELTREGRLAQNKAAEFARQREEQLLSVLTRSERIQLSELINKLTEKASEMLDEAGLPASASRKER